MSATGQKQKKAVEAGGSSRSMSELKGEGGAARRASGLEEDVAIVKTTPSATKRREEMRNESTGITVGDSAHTLADVSGRCS